MSATIIEVKPQPGPQEVFLSSPADIAICGGAAGGGKTWSLVIEPLRHIGNKKFGAVIFRRTYPQIMNEGGIWDEASNIYPLLKATSRESPPEWSFPSGATVTFAHMQYEKDRLSWKGAQIPLIGFDQLEDFTEKQFFYMLSRNRSTCGVKPYVRATCNPVPDDDPVGAWLHKFISWWIDQDTGYAIPSRSGQIRWFVRIDEELHWGDTREEMAERFPGAIPRSVTFVPAKLEDNKILEQIDPGYRANLMAMGYVDRERLLGGNWKVKPAAGKVLNRSWFEFVQAAPVAAKRVRYWDKAGTQDNGDWSAGVLMAEHEGIYYVEDVVRGQWSSRQRNLVIKQTAELDADRPGHGVTIWIEQEPGSGGKESAEISVQDLAGYDVHIERVSGDKVTRAKPFAAQAEAHNVKLVRGDWNDAYLNEVHNFPDGKNDDQVDGSSGAFNKLALGWEVKKPRRVRAWFPGATTTNGNNGNGNGNGHRPNGSTVATVNRLRR